MADHKKTSSHQWWIEKVIVPIIVALIGSSLLAIILSPSPPTPPLPAPSPSATDVPPSASPTRGPVTPTPQTPTPVAPTIVMTEPRNGWTLDCEEVIKGTYASEITEPIWAVLKYGSNFWPQEPIEQISPSWYGTVYFGECGKPEEYTGTPFQLIIVTANMNSLWT